MISSPEVPTFSEQGLGGIHLIGGAQSTPKPVVDKLAMLLNQIVAMEDTKAFLILMGSDHWISSPEIAQKQLADDIETFGRLVKTANHPSIESMVASTKLLLAHRS